MRLKAVFVGQASSLSAYQWPKTASSGSTVVDLAKDPCRMGSLARSTTENQVALDY